MKRILAFGIFLVMLFSLTACATKTKTEMLQEAIHFDYEEYRLECENNEIRARERYNGKTVRWTATVTEIKENYAVMKQDDQKYSSWSILVYMKTEDLIKLNRNEEITVVGVFEQGRINDTIKKAFVAD